MLQILSILANSVSGATSDDVTSDAISGSTSDTISKKAKISSVVLDVSSSHADALTTLPL